MLPSKGYKFLRFSLKVLGSYAKGVEEYIDTVTQVVKVNFGSYVRYQNEAVNEQGFYNQ